MQGGGSAFGSGLPDFSPDLGNGFRERVKSVVELEQEIIELQSKVVKNEGYRLLIDANQTEVKSGNARKQMARSGSLNAQRKAEKAEKATET